MVAHGRNGRHSSIFAIIVCTATIDGTRSFYIDCDLNIEAEQCKVSFIISCISDNETVTALGTDFLSVFRPIDEIIMLVGCGNQCGCGTIAIIAHAGNSAAF